MTRLLVAVDFDGTVVREDVGNRLFHRFSGGRGDAAVERWRRGEIGSVECYTEEASLSAGALEDVLAFVDGFAVDPTFPPFVRRMEQAGHRVVVLSDGMDVYVARLLTRAGLADLSFDSNTLRVDDDGRFVVGFPFGGEGCGRDAMCKGAAIDRHRGDGERVVFVGDGLSDRCALPHADLVFARGALERICAEDGVPSRPFTDFDDVARGIASRFPDALR